MLRFSLPAIAVGILIAGCASASAPTTDPNCARLPSLFDWQALDDSTLIVWPAAVEDVYELALASPIEGLAAADEVAAELLDGNQDGLICGDGLDSFIARLGGDDSEATVEVTAEVYYVERLNARAISERLTTYADTVGQRWRSGQSAD